MMPPPSKPSRSATPSLRERGKRLALLFLLLSGGGGRHAAGAVALPALISDHMVLQRSANTALWGTASPGERITATLGGAHAEATAGTDGKWRLELDLTRVAAGPFELGVAGTNKLTVSDVVVGEVWLASGQSNMEFNLARALGGPEEIAASANPELRQFRVTTNAAASPQDDCRGSWTVASPSTTGNFTAVGYYFAKKLQGALHAPVGLVASYWGGTPVEAWTSRPGLDMDPALKEGSARLEGEVAEYNRLKSVYTQSFRDWAAKYERTDKVADPAPYASVGIATTDWKPVRLPGKVRDAGLPDAGAVWVRKTVSLHGEVVKATQMLDLANLDGYETIYYNGHKVAGILPETYDGPGSPRRYYFGNSVEGDNVLAIRIAQPVGNAGITGAPDKLVLGGIPLAGEWLAKPEYALPALSDEARRECPSPPKAVPGAHLRPATLYNGMIHPLLPCTLAGVVWYQGEQNVPRAHQYGTAFPLMIKDWRRAWGRDLPFYFCQLPAYTRVNPSPGESNWAELREAQAKALALPHTGDAILIDQGEAEDIHPRDKKEAGERLGLLALAETYHKALPCVGPRYESMTVEGNHVRIKFHGADGGLVARPVPSSYVLSSLRGTSAPVVRGSPGSELEGFAICGADHHWVWAEARIEGGTVVVSSPAVAEPVAVRYAWADHPIANLYDKAGLPAAPFRTDAFAGTTDNARF